MIPLRQRTVIAGKYELSRPLATGGMGAVWVAHHLALDEDVAIKFMRGALPEPDDARARFAREARIAARLRGPHVVQVFDHGVDGDVPYLVMELLEGEHLGDRLRREGRLSLATAATIADQVARALDRAHRAGVVHRDLKPANVFLAREDEGEVVKVLDFGIAKHVGGGPCDVTHTDVVMGSPQYMSPEQARGARDVDHRADLWSLGAILFRCVTGVAAFEGSSAVDVLVRICAGPPPSPSTVAAALPAALDPFFARAFDRDPARRFASARQMADAFADLARRAEVSEVVPLPRPPRDDAPHTLLAARPAPAAAPGGVTPVSAAEIDAFVDDAFCALLAIAPDAGDGPADTPRSPERPPPTRAPESTIPLLRRLGAATARRDRDAESGDRMVRPSPTLPPKQGRGEVASLIDEGFTALRRGERDAARRVWSRALDLDPQNRLLALNLRRLDTLASAPR